MQRMNVLIVDDDEDDVFLMCSAIDSRVGNYPFPISRKVAHDGIAGIEIAKSLVGTDAAPDLMLLDLNMPRLDGLGVLSKVRETPELRHLPIVVITTASDPDTHERATALGANAVVTKPRSAAAFDRIIDEVFDTWLV
ncbi:MULTISPECIES: response regulator [unclassified Roseibium]|uniref:response regulator n=1 Tax=unclassified Roseibium TaxID=2629323 RepID=UPI00273E440F|nr:MULTISPECIES: response regulator [unclassified Roseibium]